MPKGLLVCVDCGMLLCSLMWSSVVRSLHPHFVKTAGSAWGLPPLSQVAFESEMVAHLPLVLYSLLAIANLMNVLLDAAKWGWCFCSIAVIFGLVVAIYTFGFCWPFVCPTLSIPE